MLSLSDVRRTDLAKKQKHSGFHLNIGIVIFGALVLYLVITMVLYLTRVHTETYQVTSGTLSKNETYAAIALRSEHIVKADSDGYVNYFIADGMKAAREEAVCIVSPQQDLVKKHAITSDDLAQIRQLADRYARAYDRNQFRSVYDLKFSLDTSVYGASEFAATDGKLYYAGADGIISYSSDGYESKTADQITSDDFYTKSYHKNQLKSDASVSSGSPVYRLIDSEDWSIVIALSDHQYKRLTDSDRTRIRVRFAKDGLSETGDLRFFDSDGVHYAEITFTDGMVRYCNDRFLNVELVTNTVTGLKIPKSAVIEKTFFAVPVTFVTEGGDSGDSGFLKEVTDENGVVSTSFVEATLYEETKPVNQADIAYYFVDTETFSRGDVLVKPDSDERFQIGTTAKLKGVYSTNKGYAVFRKIQILDEDDESCIIAEGTSFGVTQYDYIVRNGDRVKESDILH